MPGRSECFYIKCNGVLAWDFSYLSIGFDTIQQRSRDRETQTPEEKFTRRIEVLFQDFGTPLTILKIEKFKERAI